jgi:hypothetical protein
MARARFNACRVSTNSTPVSVGFASNAPGTNRAKRAVMPLLIAFHGIPETVSASPVQQNHPKQDGCQHATLSAAQHPNISTGRPERAIRVRNQSVPRAGMPPLAPMKTTPHV